MVLGTAHAVDLHRAEGRLVELDGRSAAPHRQLGRDPWCLHAVMISTVRSAPDRDAQQVPGCDVLHRMLPLRRGPVPPSGLAAPGSRCCWSATRPPTTCTATRPPSR